MISSTSNRRLAGIHPTIQDALLMDGQNRRLAGIHPTMAQLEIDPDYDTDTETLPVVSDFDLSNYVSNPEANDPENFHPPPSPSYYSVIEWCEYNGFHRIVETHIRTNLHDATNLLLNLVNMNFYLSDHSNSFYFCDNWNDFYHLPIHHDRCVVEIHINGNLWHDYFRDFRTHTTIAPLCGISLIPSFLL